MTTIDWQHFQEVQMRVGTIITAEDFPEAKQPAYKLQIDFGRELGIKKSSAQITERYQKEELIGRQIIAVINFPPKQIANFMSECLVLGAVDATGDVILLQPEANAANGLRIS
ncbi:MAG: tRNA-binding protein [Flavobacteriaceae bacterium CG_4_8_14_3_um_filter_34_10]|nr:MAG: tRNA-binding protein [Flavobacteriaceae bacterium CG2_30_34_30]PIQ19555.1 MAG: tRNA-binding protein [Flavobacteriaceae bacterium CG18_big_fil_WC_8_21_14_2_50_34_36]PIV48576.1 MAG: tRNA-binding protein [Flavobacteriaceae bacterium CG02_land_8_20_14_3_00_34_13]PIX09308.1 MAG: tRNA-binding protein [Flavobacteriaceae bacterium CG_4_8_14_3_um_filter_34_10]PIZ07382.1 MAG: tRNA-binding protein [Flavobacteriaceae bacterium CG_4_10_14_0_8_um_filter_34_31]PJC07778.1 MAG: tRNA-binding protein [Fl